MSKDIKGKPKLSLLPYKALVEVTMVREFGIEKYGGSSKGETSYQDVKSEDFINAIIRHAFKYKYENKLDYETLKSHLAHIACGALLALENDLRDHRNLIKKK